MAKTGNTSAKKPRLVGMNHVALEVGDIEEALAFYGAVFDFRLRSKSRTQAFIDMGDQFIALAKVTKPHRDDQRHFSVVVDDRSQVKALAEAAGGELLPGPFLDFLDPWGNRIEVIAYADIQFTKAPHVLKGMRLDPKRTGKTKKALAELAAKGMAPKGE